MANLAMAAVFNGLAQGFVKGMEMRQKKQQYEAENVLANRRMDISEKTATEMQAFREMQLGSQTQLGQQKLTADIEDKKTKAAIEEEKNKNDFLIKLKNAKNDE